MNAVKTGIVSCIPIVMGLLALLILGYALDLVAPINPATLDDATAARVMLPREAFQPKPHDRFMFPALVVGGCAALSLVAALWRRKVTAVTDPRAVFTLSALLIAAVAFRFGVWSGLLAFLTPPHRLETTCCLAFAGIAAWLAVRTDRTTSPRWLLSLLFVVTAAVIVYTRIFKNSSIAYVAPMTSHYEAAVYSIAHVAGGGTCIADVLPQYGCYGEFLAPFMKIFGATPGAMTATFIALQLISTAAILAFTAALIRNSGLVAVATVCIAILTSVTLMLGSADPYFQYNPIRLLFPALSLLCVLAIQRSPRFRTAFYVGAFAGASLAWNIDTGIAVLGALGFYTFAKGFSEAGYLSSRNIMHRLKHLACFVSGAGVFLIAFGLYLEVKSGWTVDFAAALSYQTIFYVAGFAMMPMPPFPDLWTIVAILVGTVLMLSLLEIASRQGPDPRLELAAFAAVLAVGLMLYYTGRSHLLVLRFVVWPAVILFFFLADRALSASGRATRFAIVTICLWLPLATIAFHFPRISKTAAERWQATSASGDFQQDIAFLRSVTSPGETVAIVAENQTSLYAAIGSWPHLKGPSLAETIFVQSREELKQQIAASGPKKLFINPKPLTSLPDSQFLEVDSHYDLVLKGPGDRLYYYVRRD